MSLRKFLLWLHLVVGLIAAVFLAILGFTGAAMVYEVPLDHALNAKLYHVAPQGHPLGLNELVAAVEKASAPGRVTALFFASEEDIATRATLRNPDGKSHTVTANPYTGEIIGSLGTANRFFPKVHQFHTNLLLGKPGKIITGWGALLLVVLSLTGIILWWPRKIWKISEWKPGRRANFDLHNALGFWSSIFMFLFGVTGLVVHFDEETAQWIGRLTHTPATMPIPQPKPSPNAKPASADQLYQAAMQAAPGAQVIGMLGLGSTHGAVRVMMHFPEDNTPGGRTGVFLDPTSAEVLLAQTSRDAPPGYRLAKFWNRQLHTGDILGWPSRIIACLMSLSLPLLALTGPLIWWGKFKRRRETPSSAV
ncbi:MAG TPA: PepSY-associated TM helix domain-containing protein [Chthoniobacter sp.]|jgi:uncharacterized iron-regulated membrane protein